MTVEVLEKWFAGVGMGMGCFDDVEYFRFASNERCDQAIYLARR